MEKEKKTGKFAKFLKSIIDKLDKKLEEKSKNSSCCCNKSKKDSCCGK